MDDGYGPWLERALSFHAMYEEALMSPPSDRSGQQWRRRLLKAHFGEPTIKPLPTELREELFGTSGMSLVYKRDQGLSFVSACDNYIDREQGLLLFRVSISSLKKEGAWWNPNCYQACQGQERGMQSGMSSRAVMLKGGSRDGPLHAVPHPLTRHKFRN